MNKYFEIPKNCPICGHPTVIKTEFLSSVLYCQNPQCEGKLINQLEHFCGKKGLDIKGLSKATLEKLINWGWITSCIDIFNLNKYKDIWINKPGFGDKSVNNILCAIQKAKICTLDKFIAALGIPLIGTKVAKDIANHFGDWSNFIRSVETDFKFYDLPNFGIEMHKTISEFDYAEAKDLIKNYIKFEEETNTSSGNVLENKVFVITGRLNKYKNRNELKQIIEANGGKVTESISKNTSYLINNDINSTSSKNSAAKKIGIPIITEEEFQKILFEF